ncbi:MAG: response regulator [Anaerolineae bacterium]|nr:response regulator [Anaerolineae bacterium]
MPEPGNRPNVLVVDDEPDMCWALENILSREGYQITTAKNAREALELAKEKHFEVFFIDAKLPDMDGGQLSDQIRKINSKAAIIMISGYFYQEDKAIEEGLAQGLYVGFISKPFELNEVRSAARTALEVAAGRG